MANSWITVGIRDWTTRNEDWSHPKWCIKSLDDGWNHGVFFQDLTSQPYSLAVQKWFNDWMTWKNNIWICWTCGFAFRTVNLFPWILNPTLPMINNRRRNFKYVLIFVRSFPLISLILNYIKFKTWIKKHVLVYFKTD